MTSPRPSAQHIQPDEPRPSTLPSAPGRRAVQRPLLWLAAGFIGVTGLMVAATLWVLHGQAVDNGRGLTAAFARGMEEQTARTLQSVDQALLLGAANMAQLAASGALDLASGNALMRERIRGLPFIGALWVMNAQGRIVYDSDVEAVGLYLGDRDYFTIYRTQPATGFHIGAPVRSRSSGRWIITATRPLRGPDGSFAGIIVASVSPAWFDTLWNTAGLGAGSSTTLIRRDGTVMMRSPFDEALMGKAFPNLPGFAEIKAGPDAGSFEQDSPFDGVHRLYAYRTLATDRELLLVVGQSQAQILAQWRRWAVPLLALWAAASALIALLCVYLDRGAILRMQAEAALRESEQALGAIDRRFRDLVESTDGIVWEADATSFTFTSISQNVERLLGYPAADWLQPGFWADHIQAEDRTEAVQFCAASTGRNEDHEFEYRFVTAAGRVVWLRDIVRVVTEQGQPRWLRGLMVDITAQKEAAAALRDSEHRWQFAVEGAGDGLWDWNLVANTVYFSPRWVALTGHTPDEISNHADEWTTRVHPEDLPRAMADVQRHLDGASPIYVNEHRFRCKDGQWKWILGRGLVVERDGAGKPLRMIGTIQDLTERKQAELVLQTSLHDKEALLKEVHHRVKNNLQVITSLLRLEAGRSVDTPTKAVLADMQGRIRAMALLHESVYRSGTLATIDLGGYLKQVATQAFRSLQTSNAAVQPRLRLELGSVQAGLDQATPCGLLLTELLSNALKHAFPSGAGGEVCIELQPVPAGAADLWRLRVSDNGVGLPADFAARQQDSLGLQLVSSLALQLGGSLVVGAAGGDERAGGEAGSPGHTLGGAVFSVTFAVTPPAPLVIAG